MRCLLFLACRRANHVNADEPVAVRCRYLLVLETDVGTAKGSWGALKAHVSL